ncbi:MAG: hypothetical protein AAGC65_20595 [Mucilaginibacter sp.]|uniref:hypothetical protein n=1 Tax=Mucilaginibacter sp. TaxID=1882438 RepID=UPI0031AACDA8
MKTLKIHCLLLVFSFLLAACSPISYVGDTFPATPKADIYYDAKDVKPDYKVIGHLSMEFSSNSDYIKTKLSEKARSLGADGVIILQTTGHDEKQTVKADAIKYNVK